VRLPLPLQPRLRDPAHEQFPDHSRLSFQHGKPGLYFLRGHFKFHGDVPDGVGVALLLVDDVGIVNPATI